LTRMSVKNYLKAEAIFYQVEYLTDSYFFDL
jgi:hypothetical protein